MADARPAWIDALPCAWLQLDENATVVAANAELARLVGRSLDALVGQPFDHLLNGASRVLFESYLQPLLHLHGNVEEFSLTLASAAGADVDVLIYTRRHTAQAEPADGGRVDMVLAPIRRRRKIEDELLRVKRAADHAPGLIFQLLQLPDGSQHFPYASEAIRRLYGVTADEARASAEAVLRFVEPEDRATMAAQMRAAAHLGIEWRGAFRVRLADGRECWHEGQATPRSLANGVLLWHGHMADVTERRAMEAAVADRQALERVHRARSEFLARVSHELRTPLNGILGFAQLLETDDAGNLTAQQRDRLAVIGASGRHLLQLINEVLEVTSLESGQLTVALQSMPLQPMAQRALQSIESMANAAGIVLLPCVVPTGLTVLANEQRLHQVLVNLLSNAVKYNRPGGTVQLRAEVDAQAVRIVVADSGRGLSPAQQADLFQPFNRLGAETSHTEGSGLGLVISKHLATLMQGSIAVESRLGVGSSFAILLCAGDAPAAAAPEAPPRRAAPSALAATRGQVIYAEDNEVNAVLMQAILGLRPNVTLTVAADPAQALQAALASPPDLLLLDLHLPGMNGIELLAAMRSHERLRRVPAVAVSAAARQDDIAHARAQGFCDYWTKPLDVDQTLAALDRLLGHD